MTILDDLFWVEKPSQWVLDMHKYRAEHGRYRPEDLIKVLGDPRDCVMIENGIPVYKRHSE